MALARACSECGSSLAGKPAQTKTCSVNCRSARSRRVKRANARVEEFAEQNNAGAQEVAAIVRREAPDIVTRVMRDQLQPIVREAITEDVLRAITDMVNLTPRAVQAITEDLDSENETIRQRAYTLLIKYTVGHPAIVKPVEDDAGRQLVVNFNLPRPDFVPEIADEPDTVRECDMCHEDKPNTAFVAESNRCADCFEKWRAEIYAAYS